MKTTATKALPLSADDGHTLTLRVSPGWQHVWNETHYRVSEAQAARVREFHAAHGAPGLSSVRLWVDVPPTQACPHCAAIGQECIRA